MVEAEKHSQKDPVLIIDQKRKRRRIGFATGSSLLATAVAIGLFSMCQDGQSQGPILDSTPTPAVTKVPELIISTATPIPPTPEPTPTPTKLPTATPTRSIPPTETPIPTLTRPPTPIINFIPTPTPELPTPTPTPTPTATPMPPTIPVPPPTPSETQKTYVKPGRKMLELAQRIENPSRVSKNRSFDLEFQVTPGSLKNENSSVKTEIIVPKTQEEIRKETEIARKKAIKEGKDPNKIAIETEKSISEGAVFSVPAGGALVRIVVDVPPGATPGCFDEIIYSLKSRESGANRAEIERKSLARNDCVEETLTTYFTDFYYDEKTEDRQNGTNRVIAHMLVGNSATVEQLAKLEISNCSFTIAETEAFGSLKNVKKKFEDPDLPLSLDKILAIPPNTDNILTLYFTPLAGKKPSFPWNCIVKPLREFDKQSPKPKIK